MAAPSPTQSSFAKTRGHHAPYTGTEESRYRAKCKDLKRKIIDVESENDMLTVKIDRAKRSITRMRLERALLLEKLEEKTPAHVDDSEGSESEMSSVEQEKPIRAQPSGSRRRSSTAGTSYTTLSEQSPPPPVYHPPPRAQPTNPRLHVVMQNPGSGKGRRGTPGSGKGGARPSPAPKPPRDPNAPKRPTNPFLRFCEQERDNVRALHGSDENFDLTKAMGAAWHELDDDQKRPYKNAFNEDQKRYKEDMAVYEAMKRRTGANAPVPAPHHHHHHHHHPHQPSSRTEEFSSYYGDDAESEDGKDVANITGRESPEPGDAASNADIGTPGGGSTPGPGGAGGFTAVNRRSGGLDANMFKQED